MAAVVELSNTPAWYQSLSSLSGAQKLRLAAGLVAFLLIAVVGTILGRQAEYRVLYANLADKDGGAIIAQLSTMNIPYKHADGGSAILVPADRVNDARMRLASQGLPKGSVSGFELMETNRFGMTQFQERLTFQRGLEGELTRSIQALSSVQNARVHLALPNQNGFFREQQKPSASVLLSLHPGRALERNQIAGIVHLVASSVPELAPTAVSVLDDTGKLLSQTSDGSGADAQQLQYVQQIEQQYSRRILEILEPIVGSQNVKAQVTADVDFSQTELTSESHKPNQGTDTVTIRSQQTVESAASANGSGSAPTGVPGATSNQPPAASSAPVTGGTPTLTVSSGNNGGPVGPGGRRESVVNYEVDKTVRVVRGATGVVKRLSAAVVVNHASSEVQGKVVTKPLTDQQIEQMTALVREAIGFSKDRGDSVNLMNAQFANEKVVLADIPLWKQPVVLDMARSLIWPVGTLLLGLLALQGLVRPALKTMASVRPVINTGSQLDAVVSEVPQRPSLPAPPEAKPMTVEHLRLEDARALAKQNPMAVANIVKTWVSGEVPSS